MVQVPFVRVVRRGTRGDDVLAYKRALSRAGFMQWGDFTRLFGINAERATKAFQKANKLNVDGEIGLLTHEALEKAVDKSGFPAFDSVAIKLLEEFKAKQVDPTQLIRIEICDAARYWKEHRDQIYYRQARPFPVVVPPSIPAWTDCSGFVTICYKAGGAPDPNGFHFNGLGYTGTLIGNGTKVTRNDLKLGDLVFYGYTRYASPAFPVGSPTHVAIYVGDNNVISHGSSSGPLLLPLSYRSDLNQFRTYPVL